VKTLFCYRTANTDEEMEGALLSLTRADLAKVGLFTFRQLCTFRKQFILSPYSRHSYNFSCRPRISCC